MNNPNPYSAEAALEALERAPLKDVRALFRFASRPAVARAFIDDGIVLADAVIKAALDAGQLSATLVPVLHALDRGDRATTLKVWNAVRSRVPDASVDEQNAGGV